MTNKLYIQIISDIHLEFYKSFPKITPKSKYLFLAGDIGTIENNYDNKIKKFLTYCSNNWEKIFYVLGNHEFYQDNKVHSNNKSYQDLLEEYKKICSLFTNVYLLHNSYAQIIPGLNIYGTTFWTGNFDNDNKNFKLTNLLNDYNMIRTSTNTSNVLIDNDFINSISNNEFNLLNNYLHTMNITNPQTKSIIMTHFPPIREDSSNPKYSANLLPKQKFLKNYFSWNNIYNKLDCSNVPVWISGHTHWSYDKIINNTRFISNQMGYKKEIFDGETGFNSELLFEIEY